MVAFTQGEDLPKQNAVGPHVALGGKHLIKDGLRRHPLQREAGLSDNQSTGAGLQEVVPSFSVNYAFMCTHISFADVIRVLVDISGQAEITDLHHVIVR